MSNPQVDTPLRVHWFIPPAAVALSPEKLRLIATRLVSGGVFELLLDGYPLAHDALGDVLSILRPAGIRITLVSGASSSETAGASRLDAPIPLLLDLNRLVTAQAPNLSLSAKALEAHRSLGLDPGLVLCLLRPWLPLLRPLLSWALEQQVPLFKLPNIPLDARFRHDFEQQICRASDLGQLRSELDSEFVRSIADLKMQIHDLFLWELLSGQPDNRMEYSGCQAANTLAYIDAQGNVHPCASWPLSFGSLLQQSLPELWSSALREQCRQYIAQPPKGCHGCADWGICFGGCRGLSQLHTSQSGRDLWCDAPR